MKNSLLVTTLFAVAAIASAQNKIVINADQGKGYHQ